MNKEIIYSMNTAYRGEYEIQGFSYGSGDKAACIVGAMRGNEFQQLYISSLLAKKLGELEARGAIVSGKKILLIPSINYSSFNVGKKYWITDNSDINRSFPGNPEGQATSRIAAAVMEKVTGYAYGIQFASFYMDGEFIPHVRMIETGKQSNSLASQFGMPYVLTAEPRSYDKATLNYNWQMRGTEAFSVYSGVTDTILLTPISLRACARLPSMTVDDGCIHTTSTFMHATYGARSDATSELTLTCGISLMYTLLEWTSTQMSAPSMSFMTFAAVYSPTVPSLDPGNRVFISMSNTGTSLYCASSPIGLINGYTSTIPVSLSKSFLILLISS
jgi:hypothetical protein